MIGSIAVLMLSATPSHRADRPTYSAPNGVQTMRQGNPTIYSRSLTGRIRAPDKAKNFIIVERADKERVTFVVDRKARLRAGAGTELAERKDIPLGDYNPGQTVKIIHLAADHKVLEVRLWRPKK